MEDLTDELPDMYLSIGNAYSVDHSQVQSYPRPPERGLLAGILDRAYRDLETSSDKTEANSARKTAIAWFRSKIKKAPCSRFTFHDCVTYLELGYIQVVYLLKAVEKAEAFEFERLEKLAKIQAIKAARFSCNSLV